MSIWKTKSSIQSILMRSEIHCSAFYLFTLCKLHIKFSCPFRAICVVTLIFVVYTYADGVMHFYCAIFGLCIIQGRFILDLYFKTIGWLNSSKNSMPWSCSMWPGFLCYRNTPTNRVEFRSKCFICLLLCQWNSSWYVHWSYYFWLLRDVIFILWGKH